MSQHQYGFAYHHAFLSQVPDSLLLYLVHVIQYSRYSFLRRPSIWEQQGILNSVVLIDHTGEFLVHEENISYRQTIYCSHLVRLRTELYLEDCSATMPSYYIVAYQLSYLLSLFQVRGWRQEKLE